MYMPSRAAIHHEMASLQTPMFDKKYHGSLPYSIFRTLEVLHEAMLTLE